MSLKAVYFDMDAIYDISYAEISDDLSKYHIVKGMSKLLLKQ